MRKWIIPLAVMMVVPALGAAAPVVAPPEPETLVEGHTVFTVIEQVNVINVTQEEFAAAVAVLVRDVYEERVNFRFPGVLWFNDQYLVNPVNYFNQDKYFRYPCQGAVLATNAGAGSPVAAFTAGTPVYNESYTITDPNDHVWTIDKWIDPVVGPIWAVAILNKQATMDDADDGYTSCSPYDEGENNIPQLGVDTDRDGDADAFVPGCPTRPNDPSGSTMDGTPLRCNDRTLPDRNDPRNYSSSNSRAISYNALLYMFLADLTVANATKDHREGSADSTNDVSGCHDGDDAFDTDSVSGRAYSFERDGSGVPVADTEQDGEDNIFYDDVDVPPADNDDNDEVGTGHPDGKPTGDGREDDSAAEFALPIAQNNSRYQGRGNWDCPGGDDGREGNSHAYNPFGTVPGMTDEYGQPVGICPNCAGAYNHGGSDGNVMYVHATRDIDIYFATAPVPTARNFVLVDTEGSTAPFHCEETGMAPDPVPSWNDIWGEPVADGCIDAIFPTEDDSVPEPLTESDPYYTGRGY